VKTHRADDQTVEHGEGKGKKCSQIFLPNVTKTK